MWLCPNKLVSEAEQVHYQAKGRKGVDGMPREKGAMNDNNGGVGANGAGGGVKQPFLCQGRARNGPNGFAPGGGGGGGH